MPSQAEIVRELHRLRRYIKELDDKTAPAPKILKTQQTKLAGQEEAFKQAQETLKQLKVKMHEKEVSIKSTQSQVAKYEKQRDKADNPKEYDTLKREIAASKETIVKLEDEVLEIMTDVDARALQLPEIEAATKKTKDDFARWEKDQGEKLLRFAEEKVKAQVELAATEAEIDELSRPIYDSMIRAKGVDAMSGVQGMTCRACYTNITAEVKNHLNQGNFLRCESCGRILYLES